MDHTRPELKYVNARELNGTAARLDGVPVVSSDGETLGKVDGFIVDVHQSQPRHVVVSAGWFIHKHFLVPIDQVQLHDQDTELRANVLKSQIAETPGFDKEEFDRLAAEDATRLDEMIVAATGAGAEIADNYQMPTGWDIGSPR
jgi:hypothetical protein